MGNSCPCMEAPDVFNIKDNLRRGEVGAGWLQKQGKSRGNWSKRFFVLTETKVIFSLPVAFLVYFMYLIF